MSQPFGVSCRGGLNTNLNQLEMLRQPGLATRLRNFEVDPDGGYRRINGFTQYGDTRPNSDNDILGIFVYGDGVVVCSGTDIHFSMHQYIVFDVRSTGGIRRAGHLGDDPKLR